jgi:2-polyprenyl-3-methyl-5-hydroxy-6-metoxy-1,4-benzoquinol methylase
MNSNASYSRTGRPGAYVCPRCRADVTRQGDVHVCARCGADYPILCGIPDFRVAADRYLSLEDERAKATRLHDYSRTHDFAETVAEYYRITDDVPPDMALRFADYIFAGEARGRAVLDKLPLADAARTDLLDAGCGAGGLVAAAARAGQAVTGSDIALRWLVIARKRLDEEGLDAELVCADVAAPPFADATFGRIAATDLFEHLPDPAAGARSIRALLAPGGLLYATGANRYTLATYLPAGLWGVGFLPAGLRRRYVVARRGFDTLRFLAMQSPSGLARLLAAAGLAGIRVAPMTVPVERGLSFGPPKRLALGLYHRLCTIAPTRAALLRISPVFEISARCPNGAPSSKRTVP